MCMRVRVRVCVCVCVCVLRGGEGGEGVIEHWCVPISFLGSLHKTLSSRTALSLCRTAEHYMHTHMIMHRQIFTFKTFEHAGSGRSQ